MILSNVLTKNVILSITVPTKGKGFNLAMGACTYTFWSTAPPLSIRLYDVLILSITDTERILNCK